ncbi:MAG: AAA family ATPase [Muribaculaceae bacterium]|nr:AAA family ATPase [Muribaculaceae bacterium]
MTNEKLDLAWRLVENTGANVFITGKAGTGKTTFLKRLKDESSKNIAVLAPTGIAALNAGGMTIHSFFQLSFSPFIPGIGQSGGNSRFNKYSKQKIKMLRSLDTIVIDEISMVRADLLDAIDDKLRRYRNPALPMGGVQLVMIGDIQQLPPVVREEEWRLLAEHYRSPYFFDSRLLRETPFETIELTKVYRQKDSDFLEILNAIRENRVNESVLRRLNARYIPGFDPDDSERYIRLMTHNHQAQQVNDRHMASLRTKKHVFKAQIEGDFPELIYPAEEELLLKEGAQVMFLKNDSKGAHRYYNGTIGRVKSISEDGKIIVTLDDDTPPIEVESEMWENMAYAVDEKTKEMKEKVVGRFTQIPLRAAWAITIHKSQGLTFDKAIINASAAFAHGQTYVALSRCRSLDGLVLECPLPFSAIISDQTVTSFERECSSREADGSKVAGLQVEFALRIDLEIPDLTGLRNALDTLHRTLQMSHASAFPKLTAEFGEMLANRFKEIFDVSLRFQLQLRRMAAQDTDSDAIYERLKASAAYFISQLDPIVDFLRSIPQEVDSKEARKKFEESMAAVENEVNLKYAFLQTTLEKKLTSKEYLKIKREVSLADPKWVKPEIKAKGVAANADIDDPVLYRKLAKWRAGKAAEEGVPAFQVLGNKSLVFLANERPQTKEDLLAIPGIGRIKAASYGAELLDIVNERASSE